MMGKLLSIACAVAAIAAASGGCAAGSAGSPVGPDVQAARSIAMTPTLFSGRNETTPGRSDDRYLRRETISDRVPLTTLSEYEALQ